MRNHRRARLASLVGLAGAAIQIVYGLLAIPFPYAQNAYGWDEVLWMLANVGMIGCVVVLLSLDVCRPRWLATLGPVAAIIGNVIRIAAAAFMRAARQEQSTLVRAPRRAA